MLDINLRIDRTFQDLFPINRSLTGEGVKQTLEYLKKNIIPNGQIKSIPSGTNVFDWEVPEEWSVSDAYVLNGAGEKIIDLNENNLHVVSYSTAIDMTVNKEELLNHLHTLPDHPDRVPYRTSYYNKEWGFCCTQDLVNSNKFFGPFRVVIDSQHDENGELNWLECVKKGTSTDEILISSYCCHPSLANDNLSGCLLASLLFEYLTTIDTKFTYRLLICPETIGAIAFLSQAKTDLIRGGMIVTCVAGPDRVSIKQGFDTEHFINKAAHLALEKYAGSQYTTYPFVPDGSDERQYSTPGFRIVTPSIHKSKYYEYDEYHTSADNLNYVTSASLNYTLEIHKGWIGLIESYCFPKRRELCCEYQLGKRELYPALGGTLNQKAHIENIPGNHQRNFEFNNAVDITGAHLDAFHWLMHLADGSISNFEISKKSDINIDILNEAITAMHQKDLLEFV